VPPGFQFVEIGSSGIDSSLGFAGRVATAGSPLSGPLVIDPDGVPLRAVTAR
jgi:hypothetical protein